MMKKVLSLVGARPQFIKEAMIGSVVRKKHAWNHILVHSGQHYDVNMSDLFFKQLDIKKPNYFLGIGSGSHGKQTAHVLEKFEDILIEERPDMVLVYGDTNTTVAGALAAVKLKIPVAHVEAGIRQAPKDMPEEINRVMTDHISSLLFCCSELSVKNLAHEGISNNVFDVGDVMYDLFLKMESLFDVKKVLRSYGLEKSRYVLMTMHRDFNVDDRESLASILEGIVDIIGNTGLDVVFPIHPRTRKRIEEFRLEKLLRGIKLIEPLGYFEMMSMVKGSSFVITDSGGLQKEAYFAGKRAIVVMPDTGWRELVESGWNILSAPVREELVMHSHQMSESDINLGHIYGNGSAAEKIVDVLLDYMS